MTSRRRHPRPPTAPPPPSVGSLLLFLAAAAAAASSSAPSLVRAAGEDPYAASSTQKQRQQKRQFDAHSSRRERNLDHWDGDTLAAYLGMDPETGDPLPPHPPSSSPDSSASVGTDGGGAPGRVDEYVGHDATILFYAQWCPNCHTLAPTYDAIATHLGAGTTRSNLIMALFDCERDARHVRLCSAAGVKHYPTLMFAGSGPYHDTDPVTRALFGRDRSAGPAGATKLRRTVKFQGDWRYADQVLDWIRAMRALSNWHRLNTSGALSVLRRGILRLFGRGEPGIKGRGGNSSLPVGIPPSFAATSGSIGAGAAAAAGPSAYQLERKVKSLEKDLEKLEKGQEDVNKAVTHASYVIDAVLFPAEPPASGGEGEVEGEGEGEGSTTPAYIDAFEVLANNGGWDATAMTPKDSKDAAEGAKTDPAAAATTDPAASVDPFLLRTCVVDLTLDYCTRLTTKVTTAFLDELTRADPDAPYPSMFELDSLLIGRIKAKEPYCAAFDGCFANDFKGEGCRPASCPFENDAACRLVAGCFDERIRGEYTEALAKLAEEDEVTKDAAGKAGDGGGAKKAKGGGGWGIGSGGLV